MVAGREEEHCGLDTDIGEESEVHVWRARLSGHHLGLSECNHIIVETSDPHLHNHLSQIVSLVDFTIEYKFAITWGSVCNN